MPDAVTIEKLNVLAKNIINPLTSENEGGTANPDGSRTPEGWTGNIRLIDDAAYGRCGRFQKSGSAAYSSCSTTIAISPEETLEFKMTLHPIHTADASRGLAVFVANAAAVNAISWDGGNKRWSESAANNNNAFISGYKDADDFSFTTYVIGGKVDVADVPAPKSSGATYPKCVRIKSGVQSVPLLFDEDSEDDCGWLIVRPQLHRIGDGRITAQNILAKDLSAISADLGDINAGLLFSSGKNQSSHDTEELANFFDLDTGEFRVGSGRSGETPAGEPADPADAHWYLHAIPGMGLFMKITNFVITALSSIIRGAFKITRKSGAGAGTALFALNPEAEDGEPAASMRIGAASMPVAETHYGALSRTGESTLNGALKVTDAAAGALTVKGGAGVAKNLNVGGNVAITGTLSASGALTDAAASTTLPAAGKADIWNRIQVLRNNAKAALQADATIAGKKTFTTPPAGVSNLAKHNDGVTAANIFAAPPLNTMGAVSHHHFEANPFPTANKSPIQSGAAESWDVITLNLSSDRAIQYATQVYDVSGNEGRAFIRCRHVDNTDYSLWQGWRELARNADSPSFGDLTLSGSLYVGDTTCGRGGIEFYGASGMGHGGHLDFHYNGDSGDYTSRLIEDGSGKLSAYAANGFNCQAPFLPRSSPVSGSISVSGDYTPARGLYIFSDSNTSSYYNYAESNALWSGLTPI
jgi:hypothetical protein